MQWEGPGVEAISGSTTLGVGHDVWSSSSHPAAWTIDPATVISLINWLITEFLNRKEEDMVTVS